jgi:O-antigen/teichoic acid export membrane protein
MQFGTLAVGAGAGAIEAGGFRLAYRFSQAMMKPVEIATKALFPEFARLVSEDDHSTMRKVLMQVSAISGAFACVVIVGTGLWGREILRLVAGPRFEYASGLLFLLSISAAINVIGFALEPFHNAHFRAGTVLRAYAVAAVVYAALLAILLPLAGADGAALASIVTALAILVQLSASAAGILAESRTGESERKILDTRT